MRCCLGGEIGGLGEFIGGTAGEGNFSWEKGGEECILMMVGVSLGEIRGEACDLQPCC